MCRVTETVEAPADTGIEERGATSTKRKIVDTIFDLAGYPSIDQGAQGAGLAYGSSVLTLNTQHGSRARTSPAGLNLQRPTPPTTIPPTTTSKDRTLQDRLAGGAGADR